MMIFKNITAYLIKLSLAGKIAVGVAVVAVAAGVGAGVAISVNSETHDAPIEQEENQEIKEDTPSSSEVVEDDTVAPSAPTAPQATPAPAPTPSAPRAEYNLNDLYVAGNVTWALFQYEDEQCIEVGQHTFFAVARFTGMSSDLDKAVMPQYQAYIAEHGYSNQCGGMGAIPMTWDQAVARGIALDEAKCATYGLSCGRW